MEESAVAGGVSRVIVRARRLPSWDFSVISLLISDPVVVNFN